MGLTKQNITERLYQAGLINNTAVQNSAALSELIIPVIENSYNNTGDISTAISNGTLTPDTYVYYSTIQVVDTAQRIVDNY
jgi:hypothetical protein